MLVLFVLLCVLVFDEVWEGLGVVGCVWCIGFVLVLDDVMYCEGCEWVDYVVEE